MSPHPQSSFATTGGEGEGSYSRASQLFQGSMAACLRPSLQDALVHHFSPPPGAGPIRYADFGCSVGANTLNYAKFVTEILNTKQEMLEREIVCHFADLPSNDFNTLFKQLPPMRHQGGGDGSGEERTWFAAGVPGSQYGRMFTRSSLHVAISTISLHYLPEIPKAILDRSSPTYNKGHIGCNGARPAAAEAYADAARKGLSMFFECRAKEMVSGGVLAFYCLGRRDRAHPESQLHPDSIHFAHVLEKALQELVNEGVMPEELLDSFNVPVCAPSIDEIKEAIENPTSAFHIKKLEYIDKFHLLPENSEETVFKDVESFVKFQTNMMNAAMSSMLSAHLGPELVDLVIERFRRICEKDYPIWKAAHFPLFVSLCVAVLLRK